MREITETERQKELLHTELWLEVYGLVLKAVDSGKRIGHIEWAGYHGNEKAHNHDIGEDMEETASEITDEITDKLKPVLEGSTKLKEVMQLYINRESENFAHWLLENIDRLTEEYRSTK